MIALVVLLAVCMLIWFTIAYTTHSNSSLPPGPIQFPIFGNFFQIPTKNPWRKYRTWHQQYGPVICVRLGLTPTIILGSHKAARDLLDKRSSIYSSRPHMFHIGTLIYGGLQTALLPYGPQWRLHRRIQAAIVNIRESQRYRVLQDLEAKQLLYEMLRSNDFSTNFRRYSASTLFALTYGKRMLSYNSWEIQKVRQIMDVVLTEASRTPVGDIFPILNALPTWLARWNRPGEKLYQHHVQLFAKFMETALLTNSWNACKEALNMNAAKSLGDVELSFIMGSLFEASHTTPLVLDVFMMASVLHPEAVALAQQEIDRFIGADRLPDFDDMEKLPYVTAFIREVLRWRPATPGGMAHVLVEDDEYMGYKIPKGATVVANHWSIEFDESVFERPFDFWPQRWLDNPNLPEGAFGFGRRVCPGQHIGRYSLFIAISRFLWAFNFRHAYNEDGSMQEIDPWDMTQTSDSGPMPFQAVVEPRSITHREVIEREFEKADKDSDSVLNKVRTEIV